MAEDGHTEAPLSPLSAQLRELEQALDTLEEEEEEEEGEVVSAVPAPPRRRRRHVDGHSVYVGNVEYHSTAKELATFFGTCGEVVHVTIPTTKLTCQAQGFAYIEFRDKRGVCAALTKHGSEFHGRSLKVRTRRLKSSCGVTHGVCSGI